MDEDKKPEDLTIETVEDKTPEVGHTNRKHKKAGYRRGVMTGVAATLIIVLLLGMLGSNLLRSQGYSFSRNYITDKDAANDVLSSDVQNKIAQIVSILNAYYYEDVDSNDLVEGMYAGLVDALGDKYSAYFTADEYTSYTESTSGKYYGIGAVLQQDATTKEVTIVNVYDGTPAQKAGLKAGDIIVSVAGIEATSCDLTELVTHIKGEKGTEVHIVVTRDSKEKEFDVTRQKIEVPTVTYQMLEDKIGYIEITEFGEVTANQFEEAVADLQDQGMTSLMVDLRDNPGGMLTSVTQILDDILPKGLLVYTEDKQGNKDEYNSKESSQIDLPMAVLVNGNSASASEIFAGAIRDYKYGTLIGTKTFGKGIVQVLLPLGDGSAVKVTTAKYYTPSGDYIHGKGIEPDIELEYKYQGSEDETYDIMKDNQVLKGIEVLKEKTNQ